MSPDIVEFLRDVEAITGSRLKYDFVVEVHAKDAGMVVRALRTVPVLSAGVVAELSFPLTEAFEEVRKVLWFETPVFGQGIVVVRQGYKAVVRV